MAQSPVDRFLTPSDTLHRGRRNLVVVAESTLAAGTLAGLSQVWYRDYPQSRFHFIDDNNEWLQMDKAGHVFSSYHLGRASYEALRWSGCDEKSSLWYGGTLGFAFLAVVEVFDGYSAQWGASPGDLIANATGTTLFIGQQLLWHEQRIIPKFSFHQSPYAKLRPDVLGHGFQEQLLKDYNGQTYWLSVDVNAFLKSKKWPNWLNLAVGYGADGMVSGNGESVTGVPQWQRERQFYLSLDVNLQKIPTRSHALKMLFSIFNTLKIPAPTLEIKGSGRAVWHGFYF